MELCHFTHRYMCNQDQWIQFKGEKFPDLGIIVTIYRRGPVRLAG
jgi:hypothetical protein